MKMLMTAIMSLFAFSALAQGNFTQVKEDHLNRLDKRIQMMNESRSCIVGATDQRALDTCGEKMRAQREELNEEKVKKTEEGKGY